MRIKDKPAQHDNQSDSKNAASPVPASKAEKLVEKKHRQIADGASRILLEKGYHPTTIREIAQECGMSMGQLYHYISSKDDVLHLMFQNMNEVFLSHMQHSDLKKAKDPQERLHKALCRTLRWSAANKKLIQFIFTESKNLDKKSLRAVLKTDSDVLVSYWRRMLADIAEFQHDERHLNFAANMIHYMITFLPLRGWAVADQSLDENIESIVDFVLRGIGLSRD